MKPTLYLCLISLFLSVGAFAQTQPPITPNQLQYFRYTLMTLASLDYSPSFVKAHEDALVQHLGLNQQESAVIHAAAQELHALLQDLRKSANPIVSKQALSAADEALLATLVARREQALERLGNGILNSVRPETATRLRAPGDLVAAKAGRSN